MYSIQHQKTIDKHNTHQVDVVVTPELSHYAKLVCCHCNNKFIQWLSRGDVETILGPQTKKPPRESQSTTWSNTNQKERQHYKSYQPKILQLPRTPTQLVNDRLALTGKCKYNGNHLGSIPTNFLKQLLDTNKINKKEDRQRVEYYIKLQTGT